MNDHFTKIAKVYREVRTTDEEPIRRSRLRLCRLVSRVLADGLDLLGIDAPSRM